MGQASAGNLKDTSTTRRSGPKDLEPVGSSTSRPAVSRKFGKATEPELLAADCPGSSSSR